MSFQYETLTTQDLLDIARDSLRGRESDHYRLGLIATQEPNIESRLAALEAEIVHIREEVAQLEIAVQVEEPVPVED